MAARSDTFIIAKPKPQLDFSRPAPPPTTSGTLAGVSRAAADPAATHSGMLAIRKSAFTRSLGFVLLPKVLTKIGWMSPER